MQLAYKEVVETSFPLIADKFLLYQIMPLRYEVEVVTQSRQEYDWPIRHWRWLPVGTLDESGATVSFPPQPSNTNSRPFVDEYSKRIDEALARLGRAASDEWYRWGHSMLPDFEGDHPSHTGQVDETSLECSALYRRAKAADHYEENHAS